MLPLVQMHQVVQTPSHLDPLSGSFPTHLKPDYVSYHHHQQQQQQQQHRQQQPQHSSRPSNPCQNTHDPSQRAFPIRSSQSAQPGHHRSSTFPQVLDYAEHQLRRKTPNGTIDAGYDGSPAQLASGPPPLKQMVLPGSSNIFPTAVAHRGSPCLNAGRPMSMQATGWPSTPQGNGSFMGMGTPGSGLGNQPLVRWGHRRDAATPDAAVDSAPLFQSMSQYPYAQDPRVHTVIPPSFQQAAGPTAWNPAGFNPPPAWLEGGMAAFNSPMPLATMGFPPQPDQFDNSFQPPGQMRRPHHGAVLGGPPLGQTQRLRPVLPGYPLDDGFSMQNKGQIQMLQSPHDRMQSLSLNSSTPPFNNAQPDEVPSPARFKERALARAQKTYAELLVHISHTKKAQQGGRPTSGVKTPSKMLVFPKPPKHLMTTLDARDHRASGVPRDAPTTNPVGSMHYQHPPFNRPSWMTDPRGMESAYPFAVKPHTRSQLHGMMSSSPVHNAKAALEMISNLCEQSGWKWVDGMLLGGCLQYGLEHYEEALEWFNRIINLDPSHVEAISNIAATLYCLNRPQEAEQRWLQAVKIRPSYLEAVEHLVGLLCSDQRSREAVDIISSVQGALRLLRSPETSHAHDQFQADTPGVADSTTTHAPDDDARSSLEHGGDRNSSGCSSEAGNQAGFGSSGYAIPGSENGRMVLLVHAKGNMLFALKNIDRASRAFEEAVLISAGRKLGGVGSLIRRIQAVLSPPRYRSAHAAEAPSSLPSPPSPPSAPFLLHPEKAKMTAQLVFASAGGQLPGLRYVPEGSHRKSAISTTSNSLLSLAKIFQDALSNGSPSIPAPVRQPIGVGDILALYYLSLSLQESPSTANNVGILLASVQHSSLLVSGAAAAATAAATSIAPVIPGIIPGSGLALALAYYNHGLNIDPKHVHLHTNLGSLLKDVGQLDLAIQMYEQAVACDGNFDIALTNLANAVKDRGRVSDAIMYYKRAVISNPDFAEAVCGLSTALNSVCDWRERGGVVLYGTKYDRWHVEPDGQLSDVKQHGQSRHLMGKVVAIVARQLRDASLWGMGLLRENMIGQMASQLKATCPDIVESSTLDLEAELQKWAGQPWEGSRLLRLVERATRAAMHAWYQDKYVRQLDSPKGYYYPRPRPPSGMTVPSAPTVLPFHTFTCPLTAKDIRMISQCNALRISCTTLRSPWLPNSVFPPPKPPSPQLNIGYVSSDFNNHPLAHLMQSVFGFHDPSRAKAICYATTASDKSIHRQQIEREAPAFRDVSNWSSERLVNQIIQDEIHILVNLNGYTRGARNEVFAARPAPIQMSFMGFAGTLGAEWCDYILADTTAIPPETLRPWRQNLSLLDIIRDEEDTEKDDWVYSENIIFCRETFFCCDHRQSADEAERNMSWEGEQRRRWNMRKELFPSLPDDAIIMGNFNQLYKIDPTTFRTWLRILSNVPKAVLWLLRFPELGENNLRRTALQWSTPEVSRRIIFTDVAPKQQHISRARVCDIFLDTPECNAHTTAADVLWSSTPLLTLPRYQYKMCSRMAASILKGALPRGAEGEKAAAELIAGDDDEYEALAIRLAGGLSYRMTSRGYGEGSGRLAELRKLLWRSKWTCALFDTHRWVSDLEEAYEEAWRRWVAGEGGDIYL